LLTAALKRNAKTMTSPYVVDSSVVLAILRQEVGHETALLSMADSLISAVNYSELLAKLTDLGTPIDTAIKAVASLSLNIIPFDAPLAETAASLRPFTRSHGISFADRACLGLAKARQLTALTADRIWLDLSETLGITVKLIR
jgi:ribonuclease VapC